MFFAGQQGFKVFSPLHGVVVPESDEDVHEEFMQGQIQSWYKQNL